MSGKISDSTGIDEVTANENSDPAIDEENPGPIQDAGVSQYWAGKLIHTIPGKPKTPIKRMLYNVLVPLRDASAWRSTLGYDAMKLRVELLRAPPWASAHEKSQWESRAWEDQDDRLLAAWLQKHGIDVSSALAREGVETVARENSFHPLRDYLNGLKWDGVERLSTWLHIYLGAENSDFHSIIGTKWMISAIARAFKPGCKVDCLLQLVGQQGVGKGTALSIIAVNPKWFSDEIRDIGGRDAAMGLAGRWIVEFAELDAFTGKTAETKKSFISRSVDAYRPPWGRSVGDFPRQCVFAASTNRHQSLDDSSGNRRFWPVRVEKIDIQALKQDRDQLWAEAIVLFNAGREWWLEDSHEKQLATEAQEDSFIVDDMEEDVIRFLFHRSETSTRELITGVFEKELADSDRKLQRRIVDILHHIGWERKQKRLDNNRRGWVYVPTATWAKVLGRDGDKVSGDSSGDKKS